MRILQLIQKPQRRGAEIFAAQLGEQLKLIGNDILLVSIFQGEADLPYKGQWIKLNRPISNRFFDFKGWRNFSRIIEEFQPDIIQANAADTLKFSVFSKIAFGWKTPIVYRNANQMGDFIKGTFHKRFNQFLLNKVSGVISVSEASRRDFHQTFTFPTKKSTFIPIGIDSTEIDSALKCDLEIQLPDHFIIQVGGLVKEKDPFRMLSIFQGLRKELPYLHLIFLGSGHLEAELREETKTKDLKEIVHFIPPQSNVFPILSKARALVMPSKIEGLPGVILEALYCKIPVVAYNVGGISELLNKGTGWLIPADDSDSFKSAIVELMHLTNRERDKITMSGHRSVTNQFRITSIAKKFDGFYKLLK